MAKMHDIEKKYFIPRAIAVVVFLGIGITGIVFGVKQCTTRNPGFYTIEPTRDDNIPGLTDAMKLIYYFDGNDAEIKNNMTGVTDVYTKALKDSYTSISRYSHYDGFTSIYDINNNLGKEVVCTKYFYDTFKNVYELSKSYSNYSLFAAPIYDFWGRQFLLDNALQNENDPINNETIKNYLEKLVDYCNDISQYTLTFNDENRSIKLDISEEYFGFVKDYAPYEYSVFPFVSFNVLEDYIMTENVSKSLENSGFLKGLLTTLDGSIMTSKGNIDSIISLYDYSGNNDGYYAYGRITVDRYSTTSENRHFEITKRTPSPFYEVSKDGVKYHRSNCIDISTGYPNNFFSANNLFSTESNSIDIELANNELLTCNSLDEVNAIKDNDVYKNKGIIFTLFNESKTCYASLLVKDKISMYSELTYNVKTL